MADLKLTDSPKKVDAARLGIGSNNPPSDIEWLGENLILRHVHIVRAAESHMEIAGNIPDHFTDENEAKYTTDFIKLMQNCQKELERRRKEEKEPFLRQGQYVDTFFGDISTKLDGCIKKAYRPLNDWLQRKAEKERAEREADAKMLRERQEAALRDAQASRIVDNASGVVIHQADAVERVIEATQQARIADAIAAAPITSLAKTVGNSASASMAMKWIGIIKNIDELDMVKLRPYISNAELQKALDRFVKQGGRVCDGAEIRELIDAKVK